MPYCGVHYLWFPFVCFLIRSSPPQNGCHSVSTLTQFPSSPKGGQGHPALDKVSSNLPFCTYFEAIWRGQFRNFTQQKPM